MNSDINIFSFHFPCHFYRYKYEFPQLPVKFLEKVEACKNQWRIQSIKRERNTLIELKGSSWFTKLIFAKNCKNAIYFGLEFYIGGDLFNLQQQKRYFTEEACCFYIAELLVAIDILHSLGIIHRDLKRENIFLVNTGHIVIGDFGFSKRLEDKELAYSQLGTPGYIAPEIFLGNGYSFAADIFAVGVIFIELLTGNNPFISFNLQLPPDVAYNYYKNQVLTTQPQIKSSVSQPAVEVGQMMLSKNPARRFGLTHLKTMAFFENIKWTQVAAHRLKPPFTFDFPTDLSTKNPIHIDLRDYAGNDSFKDFDYQLPPTQSQHERIVEYEKGKCEKRVAEVKTDCFKLLQEKDEIIKKLRHEVYEKNEKINNLNQGIRKRPGPALQEYTCNSNKEPCMYCNKGLSDKKALKKHIKAIHSNKENY